MTVVIHQPEFLPWLGFWNRLSGVDAYVVLDTATYQKYGFIKRNKIKTQKGWEWFGMPLQHESSFTQIKDLFIDNTKPWRQRLLNLVRQNYAKALYFGDIFPWFESVISRPWEKLVDLNLEFLKEVAAKLYIPLKIVIASDLKLEGRATDLLIGICKNLGADTYLSGPGRREGKEGYMEVKKFKEAGIQLKIHEFTHPEYRQQFMEQGFLPYMSVLDLLLNEGPKSEQIVK